MAGIVPRDQALEASAAGPEHGVVFGAEEPRVEANDGKDLLSAVDFLELADEPAPDVRVGVWGWRIEDGRVARQRMSAEDVLGEHAEHRRDGECPLPVGIRAVGRLVDAKDDVPIAVEAGRDVRHDRDAAGRETGRGGAVLLRGGDGVGRLGEVQPIELLRRQLTVEARPEND